MITLQHVTEIARAAALAGLALQDCNDLRKNCNTLMELRKEFEMQFAWLVFHAGGDNDYLTDAASLNEDTEKAFFQAIEELVDEEAKEAGYDIAKRHGTYSVSNGSVA